jgi:hypothetical protein
MFSPPTVLQCSARRNKRSLSKSSRFLKINTNFCGRRLKDSGVILRPKRSTLAHYGHKLIFLWFKEVTNNRGSKVRQVTWLFGTLNPGIGEKQTRGWDFVRRLTDSDGMCEIDRQWRNVRDWQTATECARLTDSDGMCEIERQWRNVRDWQTVTECARLRDSDGMCEIDRQWRSVRDWQTVTECARLTDSDGMCEIDRQRRNVRDWQWRSVRDWQTVTECTRLTDSDGMCEIGNGIEKEHGEQDFITL